MSTRTVIPLAVPCLSGNVRRYLDECIETNFVSSVGPFVGRFEREFAEFVGARYAVACVNGTAAIHLAMRLLGVGPGDHVIVSSFTFVASVNAVLYEHAVPVLVDSERESWNLDPALVAELIRQRAGRGEALPKAVEVVHILGHPANIEPIVDVCDEFQIPIIEDAAESLGATYTGGRYAGRHVGTIGQIGCFSFNGNKIITTGGGGMLVTDDEQLARRAKHLTTQARLPGLEYAHDEVGYNYRLTNFAAALGVSQLEQLAEFLRRKREIAARYNRAFAGVPGLTLPPSARWADPSMWLYTVLVDAAQFGCDRTELLQRLGSCGIEGRPVWPPVHTMPVYAGYPYRGGRVAEDVFAKGATLPCSVGLTAEEQDVVIESVLQQTR